MGRMSFVSSLFRSRKNLSKEVKVMKDKRCNEFLGGFKKRKSHALPILKEEKTRDIEDTWNMKL